METSRKDVLNLHKSLNYFKECLKTFKANGLLKVVWRL